MTGKEMVKGKNERSRTGAAIRTSLYEGLLL